MKSNFKSLSKNELARRLQTAISCANTVTAEFEKCLNGYIEVCAHLMHENYGHPFLQRLTPSSIQKVCEKYQELYPNERGINAILSGMRKAKEESRAIAEDAGSEPAGCNTEEL